ncbi:MAG: hypothetical protein D4R88_03595 [Methanosarcinales archaeon]|nr:MAG: hypothetical protein D4R88_03595 [Methanosarcinales archaeon]
MRKNNPLGIKMELNELILIVFLINLPFGYMRSKATRFSRQWMMAIHIPVPFVFLLRVFSGLNWTVIPLLVLSDIAGQMVGGKLKKREADKLT